MRTDDLEVYKALLEGGVDLSHHSERETLLEVMIDKDRSVQVLKWAMENGQDKDKMRRDRSKEQL